MNTASPGKTRIPGRAWALTGFLLGSAVSVGGNLQAAWLAAEPPSIASQAGAIVWPLSLMVSVEVLSRIAWPDGWGWRLVRVGGLIAVAGGSGVISYGHIHAVLTAWGYGTLGSAVGPLVVDGLMLISGFALVSIGKASRVALDAPQAAFDPSTWGQPHPEPALRPQTPSSLADGEPPASLTTPSTPDPVAEAAPKPAPRPRPAKPAASKTAPQPTQGAEATEVDDTTVFAHINQHHSDKGEWPSVYGLRQTFGIGHKRAVRLLDEAEKEAKRLKIVKSEVSA